MQAKGSVLVQGAASAAPEGPQWVRVQRAFLLGGQRQEPGTQISVPRPVADELVASNKAVRCEAPEPPAAPAPTPKPAAKRAAGAPAQE